MSVWTGSLVRPDTVALFGNGAVAVTGSAAVAVNTIEPADPTASVAARQVTGTSSGSPAAAVPPPARSQVNPAGALTKSTGVTRSLASGSMTVTLCATDGPLFVTRRVNVTG